MANAGMDRPPLPSPDVQSQMGIQQPPPPGSGLSAIAQRNQAVGPNGSPTAPGAPNPHGFLMAQVDAVKKVLDQIANTEPVFAPFAQRAQAILETGMSAVSAAPTTEDQSQQGPGQQPEGATGGPPPPPPGIGGNVPPMG